MSQHHTITPGGRLRGELDVPGDKSISHRTVMLGAIAEGRTTVSNLLEGEDVLATVSAFRQMGVNIERNNEQQLIIDGVGLHGLQAPQEMLDLGNSGTAFRLMMGLLAGQGWAVGMTGDVSLRSRPMTRIIKPLGLMGARIEAQQGKPPVQIHPQMYLNAIDYRLPVASAQVKSAILLAGLYAQGKTMVHEPSPTRDHSERMLRSFGYRVEREGSIISLEGGGKLNGCEITVPADLSSAAFFIVAALIMPDSEIVLRGVGLNPTRDGVIAILRKMGAQIALLNPRRSGAEPVVDIQVQSSSLNACEIHGDEIALAIDEIPIIAIAAACAQGQTIISGAKELRVKESDRIDSVVKGLRQLSIEVSERPDGMLIEGGKLSGGVVESYGDHRIAMAFSIAGTIADAAVEVRDCANVNTSFPGFIPLARQSGIAIND